MADVQEKTSQVCQSGCIPKSVACMRKGDLLVEQYVYLAWWLSLRRLEAHCFLHQTSNA